MRGNHGLLGLGRQIHHYFPGEGAIGIGHLPNLEEDVRCPGSEVSLVLHRSLKRERSRIHGRCHLLPFRGNHPHHRAFGAGGDGGQKFHSIGLNPLGIDVCLIIRHLSRYTRSAVIAVKVGKAGLVGEEIGHLFREPGADDGTTAQAGLQGRIGHHLVLPAGKVQIGHVGVGAVHVLQHREHGAAVVRREGNLRPSHAEICLVRADELVLPRHHIEHVELVHMVVLRLGDTGHVAGQGFVVVEAPAIDIGHIRKAGGLTRGRIQAVEVYLLVVGLVSHPVQAAVLLVPLRMPEVLDRPVIGRQDLPFGNVRTLCQVQLEQRIAVRVPHIGEARGVVGKVEAPGAVREAFQERLHGHLPAQEFHRSLALGGTRECCSDKQHSPKDVKPFHHFFQKSF